jgi:hypothetical protein
MSSGHSVLGLAKKKIHFPLEETGNSVTSDLAIPVVETCLMLYSSLVNSQVLSAMTT